MRFIAPYLAACAALAAISGAQAFEPPVIYGTVGVIDGDTIAVNGLKVRLDGIDAPEGGQTCKTISGQTWSCGLAATEAMVLIAGKKLAMCDVTGRDRYRRRIGICRVIRPGEMSIEIGGEMVERGLAVAYRKYSLRYVPNELRAKAFNRGMWAGEFQMPWDYRKAKKAQIRARRGM